MNDALLFSGLITFSVIVGFVALKFFPKNPLIKAIYIVLGCISLVLGVIGIFLPFLPLSLIHISFSGGILAVLCVSMVASRNRNQDPILVLVLSGIAIGSLLGAGISLDVYKRQRLRQDDVIPQYARLIQA